jgi:hypothetical protein
VFETQPAIPDSRSMKRTWPTVSADALSPLTIVPRWLNPPLYGPSRFRFEGFDFCCKQFCASAQRAIELQRLCD